ncbi:MAG: phosphatidylinositol-3-phosphatase [Frankiales bacterium]|nr:phosphatidylinositol-3-phosphatase [Frankiales bacterium]
MNVRLVACCVVLTAACGGGSTRQASPVTAATTHLETSAGSAATSTGPPATTALSSSPAPTSQGPPPAGISKVLTIVEENHSLAEMRAGMPYLSGLATGYGYAADYRAITHPSLPNYLAISGGSTFGITDDASPRVHPLRGASVFGQALAAGGTARLYAESLPSTCDTLSSGAYAVKHAPWAYYVDERAQCAKGMVPAGRPTTGQLADDITKGQLPSVGMLVPNLNHDAHDGTLRQADDWLKGWLPMLMTGPDFRAGRLVVVVTGDEDDSSSGNQVLTVVITPGLAHRVVETALNHYSLTRLYDEVVGAPPLRDAATAPSLAQAFGLHLAHQPA